MLTNVKGVGDKIYFLGRVIERTAHGFLVDANPKYIRDVIAVLGLGDSRPVATQSVKKTPANRVSCRAGERETSRVQDSREKSVARSVLTPCTA